MKKQSPFKSWIILFLLPLQIWGQTGLPAEIDITGLWKGELYNDSTQKYLSYEIAISEEKGKLTGYSYIVFDIDGKKEIGVKKIRVQKKDDKIIIEDVEFIENNYSVRPGKGVRIMSIVNLSVNDTTMLMAGRWKTNRTREYSSLTGNIHVQRKADFKPMALFKKLEELALQGDLSFVKLQQVDLVQAERIPGALPTLMEVSNAEMPPRVVAAKPGNTIKENTSRPFEKKAETTLIPNDPSTAVNRPGENTIAVATERPGMKVPVDTPSEQRGAIPAVIKPVSTESSARAAEKNKPILIPGPATNISSVTKKPTATVTLNDQSGIKGKPATGIAVNGKSKEMQVPLQKKSDTAAFVSVAPIKKSIPLPVSKSTEITGTPPEKTTNLSEATTPKQNNKVKELPAVVIAGDREKLVSPISTKAAANVAKRKILNIQSVFYRSDSLVLTLYDNGEIDGDTVSVLMNGNVIISKQGLDTKPNFKTITINKESPDSIMLVMYAENLGTIPPNTGLLVVHDGDAVYEVRFSADLKTNAAILLRRYRNN